MSVSLKGMNISEHYSLEICLNLTPRVLLPFLVCTEYKITVTTVILKEGRKQILCVGPVGLVFSRQLLNTVTLPRLTGVLCYKFWIWTAFKVAISPTSESKVIIVCAQYIYGTEQLHCVMFLFISPKRANVGTRLYTASVLFGARLCVNGSGSSMEPWFNLSWHDSCNSRVLW